MADWLGDVIGGIGSLIGADSQARAADKQNKENYYRQKEFAKNSIQWKVEDAKQAGLSPLVALGASTTGFAPSHVGDSGMADAMGRMGQGIGRAANAALSRDEQIQTKVANDLRLENMSLQNDLLRSQITNIQNPTTPGLPGPESKNTISGQGDSLYVPSEQTVGSKTNVARAPGIITSHQYQYGDNADSIVVTHSKDSKERTEDDLPMQLDWYIRNKIRPAISGLQPPSPSQYPLSKLARSRGADTWKWSPINQAFRPYNSQRKIFIPTN